MRGELRLALSAATFKTWGGHYARSLLRAHQLQLCHNFKDPSVQLYTTPAFKKLLELADRMFVLLPPPRVGRNRPSIMMPGDREILALLPWERLKLLDDRPGDQDVSAACVCVHAEAV